VLSTTRQAGRLARLKEHGVDHPLLDTGQIAPAVRELYPDGVDAALDLVGTPTLPDTLRAVRVHGTACFSGSLSNQWTVRDFAPNEYLPKGVRLAGYSGDAPDLPREALQEILDAISAGRLSFPVDRVYDGLEQVRQAHGDMEHDRAAGKLVVRVRLPDHGQAPGRDDRQRKLVELKVRDVDFALGKLAKHLSTRSVRLARMILIQAIRNAMVNDLVVRNVADLAAVLMNSGNDGD
jgi:Zinc-binding dehydrogenase